MEGNLENVKKYMEMIGEITQKGEYRDFEIAYLITEAGGYIDKDENNITEKDVKKVNILINVRDEIVDKRLLEDIMGNL